MSDTVALIVKWGKETVILDFVVAGGVKGLKTELEEKTRVPADRMKLMAKSKGEILNFRISCIAKRFRSRSFSQLFQACGRVF